MPPLGLYGQIITYYRDHNKTKHPSDDVVRPSTSLVAVPLFCYGSLDGSVDLLQNLVVEAQETDRTSSTNSGVALCARFATTKSICISSFSCCQLWYSKQHPPKTAPKDPTMTPSPLPDSNQNSTHPEQHPKIQPYLYHDPYFSIHIIPYLHQPYPQKMTSTSTTENLGKNLFMPSS